MPLEGSVCVAKSADAYLKRHGQTETLEPTRDEGTDEGTHSKAFTMAGCVQFSLK